MFKYDKQEARERLIAFLERFPYTTAFVVFAMFGMAGLVLGNLAQGSQTVHANAAWDMGLKGLPFLVAGIIGAAVIVYRLANHPAK
jgi:hypothetical protein